MAATRIIEEDRGAYVGFVHAHNGYYAGDFSRRAVRAPIAPNAYPIGAVRTGPERLGTH